LPLAIELAAARVRLIPPQVLLDRLEHRLQILTGGSPDLAARHQTLRTALDWSYDFLTPEEQQLFEALAVFDGGACLEAIERVSRAEADVLYGGLESLLDESLLVQSIDEIGRPRFGMLQTILEYAREKLAASGREADARDRHARFFVDLGERAAAHLTGPDQVEWIRRMTVEHGNFREALTWSLDTRDGELGLRLGAALWRFWLMTGHLTEGRRWLGGLLAAFPDGDDEVSGDPLRARVLRAASGLAAHQTDFAEAMELGLAALSATKRAGDVIGTAETLNSIGMAARNWGHYDQAMAYFEEALQIYRETGDRRGVAVVLNNMATASFNMGDLERAGVLQEESLALRRRLGDTWGIAMVLNNMAEVAVERGHLAEAAAYGRESLSLRREIGDRNSVALVLATLGTTARAQGDYVQAFDCHRESLRISRDLHHPGLAVTNLEGLAEVIAVSGGDSLQAARLLGAVEAMTGDMRVTITPMDRARFERTIEKVRHVAGTPSSVSSEEFDTAWRLGRSLTLERASDEALSVQLEQPQKVP
jgi:tetratricopeptide (TPR) repeat protein